MPAGTDNVVTFPDRMHRQWKVFEDMFNESFHDSAVGEQESALALENLKPIFLRYARAEPAQLTCDPEDVLRDLNAYVFRLAGGLMIEILTRQIELQRLRRRDA